MAKKKAKKPVDEKAKIREIYAQADYIEAIARRMYDSGGGVSITKIYHSIKERLGLPGYYGFAYGDAIKDVLREGGWVKGAFGGPV